MRWKRIGLALCMGLWVSTAAAAEYFVSPRGNDASDGLGVSTAFRTVARGASGLQPGDTLTILPGEYFESMELGISGRPEAPIVIRAARPRSVLLRGDVDVTGFRKVPGTEYTWVAHFDGDVQGVGERNTGVLYDFVPSAVEVEDVRGACHYDEENRLLFVHTSDSRAPDAHALVASVTNGFGMLFRDKPTDIVVEGIGFSGYMSRDIAPLPGNRTRWGLYFVEPERVTVRNCVAFLNGSGIGMVRPTDCIIEDCEAFGNFSTFSGSGGNIISWTPARNTVMRRNLVYNTVSNGIRFYGGGTEDCVMEANISWNCSYGEIWIKGGANATSRMTHNISLGALQTGNVAAENVRHNIFQHSPNYADDGSNINMGRIRRLDLYEHFVSPDHLDYRLQSDSTLRGTGSDGADPGPHPYRNEVFFVGPGGGDDAPGTSVNLAWRTLRHALEQLRPGHTLYVLPGEYAEPALRPSRSGEPARPIVIRGRAPGVVIRNPDAGTPVPLNLDGLSNLRIEDMAFEGSVNADGSRDIILARCRFPHAVTADNARGLAVRNSSAGNIAIVNSTGTEITGTLLGGGNGSRAYLELDTATSESLWSERNAFTAAPGRPPVRLDGRAFDDLESWSEATGHDTLSTVVAPGQEEVATRLAGRGPMGTNIGPWRTGRGQAPAQIENVRVHSVTATTANIEWWTPNGEATTTLEWGPTPELDNRVEDIFTGGIFHTVSLVGLEPGREYHFRVSATRPVWEFHLHEDLARIEQEKERATTGDEVRSFLTLRQDAPPATYHVAQDGDDAADGLSPGTAWRTIRHAASAARAGDTVLIHGGEYEEFVVVRATGDAGRPLTFRAAPGAQVWMNGSGQKRPTAFAIPFKHHVVLDGIRLRHFRSRPYNSSSTSGAIEIRGGSDIIVRRCFYDGRSDTYMPFFVLSAATRDLLLENNVVINGWNGISLSRSPGMTLRHNVFYNGLIRNAWMFNEADEPVRFHHNIVCDNIPGKLGNTPVGLWHLESLQSDYNCYFVRTDEAERELVSYIRKGGERTSGTLTLDQLRETGRDRHSIVANPGIPVTPEMRRRYDSDAEYRRLEMHRNGMDIRPLDFADFMADPDGPAARAADGRPIGLDPAAFRE